ncbi:MAG TPA: hypothetical protein RWO09_07910 [Ruminococcus sp.]
MLYELMSFMLNAPATGDDFQAGKFIIIGAAAVCLAVVTAVIARLKGSKDNDDDEKNK